MSGVADPRIEVAKQTANWLARQEFNNVLLALILSSGVLGGYWIVNDVVPTHLKQIHSGYDEIAKRHDETVLKLTTAFESRCSLQEKRIDDLMNKVFKLENADKEGTK